MIPPTLAALLSGGALVFLLWYLTARFVAYMRAKDREHAEAIAKLVALSAKLDKDIATVRGSCERIREHTHAQKEADAKNAAPHRTFRVGDVLQVSLFSGFDIYAVYVDCNEDGLVCCSEGAPWFPNSKAEEASKTSEEMPADLFWTIKPHQVVAIIGNLREGSHDIPSYTVRTWIPVDPSNDSTKSSTTEDHANATGQESANPVESSKHTTDPASSTEPSTT